MGQTGGATGAAGGGQPVRLSLPAYPGGLPMGRTDIGAALGDRLQVSPPGAGLSLGIGAVSLGPGPGAGAQSPADRRGEVKQDPELDSDLEITDLSDCSSDNENEPEFSLVKGSGLNRSQVALDGKKGSILPPITSLPPPASPHPLKTLLPISPPPASRSPSSALQDRHRETETLKMLHS